MNQELKELYEEDLADRESQDMKLALLEERDRERKERVEELISQGKLKVAEDYHHAALIFQHGYVVADYDRANELAKKAVEPGDNSARWLYAATKDRSLLSQGLPQKYGTQFMKNSDGEWVLVEPVDPNTTDEERAEWDVPPLDEALPKFKDRYGL